jgi:hypothetical protein
MVVVRYPAPSPDTGESFPHPGAVGILRQISHQISASFKYVQHRSLALLLSSVQPSCIQPSASMTLNPPDDTEQEKIIQALCHSHQSTCIHYKAFLRFYLSTCLERGNVFVPMHPPIFQTHSDIIGAIKVLRESASLSRESFQTLAFPASQDARERENATRTAVKVAFMVDCASKDDYSDGYQLSRPLPVKWTAEKTFIDFLQGAFPSYGPKPFHKACPETR